MDSDMWRGGRVRSLCWNMHLIEQGKEAVALFAQRLGFTDQRKLPYFDMQVARDINLGLANERVDLQQTGGRDGRLAQIELERADAHQHGGALAHLPGTPGALEFANDIDHAYLAWRVRQCGHSRRGWRPQRRRRRRWKFPNDGLAFGWRLRL